MSGLSSVYLLSDLVVIVKDVMTDMTAYGDCEEYND